MRKGRTAVTAVEGLLIALVFVVSTIALASVIVAMSGSQLPPSSQSEFVSTQPGIESSSTVSETSLRPINQTTTGQQTSASSPETTSVSILPGSGDQVEVSFSPDPVTVVIGVNNTVQWVNNDNTPHTVTAKDGSFASGNIGAGGTYTHTFTTPGTYSYYCEYHLWMIGTLVVKAG